MLKMSCRNDRELISMDINTEINSLCYKRCGPGKSEKSVVGSKNHVMQVNWLIDYVTCMYNII